MYYYLEHNKTLKYNTNRCRTEEIRPGANPMKVRRLFLHHPKV